MDEEAKCVKPLSHLKVERVVENNHMVSNWVRPLCWMKNIADCVDLGFGVGGKWENDEVNFLHAKFEVFFRTSGKDIDSWVRDLAVTGL